MSSGIYPVFPGRLNHRLDVFGFCVAVDAGGGEDVSAALAGHINQILAVLNNLLLTCMVQETSVHVTCDAGDSAQDLLGEGKICAIADVPVDFSPGHSRIGFQPPVVESRAAP